MTPRPNREPRPPTPAGEHPADGSPGGENGSPGGENSPISGDATTVAGGVDERVTPGAAPPPGANQGKPEPVPAGHGPEPAASAGVSARLDRRQGTMSAGNPQAPSNIGQPAPSEPDAALYRHVGADPHAPDTNIASRASRSGPTAPPDAGRRPVPSPGQAAAGVSAASTQTAPGTSEESPETRDAKTAASATERAGGGPEGPTVAP